MHNLSGYLGLLGLALAGGYLVSLLVHPHTDCRCCNGKKVHRGSFYTRAHRMCGACGGRGWHRRPYPLRQILSAMKGRGR